MRKREWIGRAVVTPMLLTTFLAGCSNVPTRAPQMESPKTFVELDIQSSSKLNPDIRGRASPVIVRLYELKSPVRFNQADFFALHEQDSAILGEDLLAKEEFTVNPSELRPLQRQLNPRTRYLGILATYRAIDQAVWRVSTRIIMHQTNRWQVFLDTLGLRVTLQK